MKSKRAKSFKHKLKHKPNDNVSYLKTGSDTALKYAKEMYERLNSVKVNKKDSPIGHRILHSVYQEFTNLSVLMPEFGYDNSSRVGLLDYLNGSVLVDGIVQGIRKFGRSYKVLIVYPRIIGYTGLYSIKELFNLFNEFKLRFNEMDDDEVNSFKSRYSRMMPMLSTPKSFDSHVWLDMNSITVAGLKEGVSVPFMVGDRVTFISSVRTYSRNGKTKYGLVNNYTFVDYGAPAYRKVKLSTASDNIKRSSQYVKRVYNFEDKVSGNATMVGYSVEPNVSLSWVDEYNRDNGVLLGFELFSIKRRGNIYLKSLNTNRNSFVYDVVRDIRESEGSDVSKEIMGLMFSRTVARELLPMCDYRWFTGLVQRLRLDKNYFAIYNYLLLNEVLSDSVFDENGWKPTEVHRSYMVNKIKDVARMLDDSYSSALKDFVVSHGFDDATVNEILNLD